jgi:hypothetical protein
MTTVYERAREEMRPERELLTLQDLAAEVVRLEETKADRIVDTRLMSATTAEGVTTLSFDAPYGEVEGGPLNDHAHGQIAARLQIPKKYYDRMRAENPALLDQNIGSWFRMKPERRLVRMLDGRVRAFLSDRYRRLDNVDLMQHAVVPLLSNPVYGDLMYHVAAITDEKLYVRALLPETRPVRIGDEVQRGIEFRNSEVGDGALVVAPFVWRLRCLNGLVRKEGGITRYHVGRAAEEEAYAIYRDDTLAADDAAFFLKVRDAAEAALSETVFDEIVEEMRAAAEGREIENPVKATEALASSFDLNETESARVLRELAAGGDLTRWGAVNALTAAAKSSDTFVRKHEMESAGGALLSASDSDWATIIAA